MSAPALSRSATADSTDAGRSAKAFDLTGTRPWAVVCGILIATILLSLAIDAVFDRNFDKNFSDGMGYLDMADGLAHGRPAALLNSYWSPGYPVVLFLGLSVLHPSPPMELPAIYAIDAAIGVFALCCLVYLVTGVPTGQNTAGGFGLTRLMLLAVACALFLMAEQEDVPIQLMTPDFLLAGFLWLAGGAFLRVAYRQRLADYAVLAVAAALAYFTKAVAMSLVLLAVAILPFTGANRRKAMRGVLLYAVVAACLIAPYVAKLSAAKGHFTFGESGALNYAWIVDQADSINRWHMQPDSPHGHARLNLTHPARRLMTSPDVYDFSAPLAGTYPIYDDPSYWNDGLKPAFYLKGEVWHIAMNLYHTASWLARRGVLVIALVILLLVQWKSRTWSGFRYLLPVILWFTCMWGLYLLVDVEDRYVFAILSAILLLAAAAIRLPASSTARNVTAACVLVLACGVAARSFEMAGTKVFSGFRQKLVGSHTLKSFGPFANPYSEAAQTLRDKLGLRPNDSVACMQLGCDNTYWARPAGLRITAQIGVVKPYWESSPEDRARAMNVLAGAGVKAVVTRHLGPGAESEGWVPLTDPIEVPPQAWYAKLTSPSQ